jgi:hypothetical protein
MPDEKTDLGKQNVGAGVAGGAVTASPAAGVGAPAAVAVEGQVTTPGLGPKQQMALELICLGTSLLETSRLTGVSRMTLYRWLRQDPVFRAAYNQWQDEMDESCRASLEAMKGKAAKALELALEKGDARAAIALLKGLGVFEKPQRRVTDPNEVRRRRDLEAKKQQTKLEEEERRVVLHRDITRMMDSGLENFITEDSGGVVRKTQPPGRRVNVR